MLESGPTSTVKVPSKECPPVEVKRTSKVALPCRDCPKVSMGSTVKVQPSPETVRATEVSLSVSMFMALEQVTV